MSDQTSPEPTPSAGTRKRPGLLGVILLVVLGLAVLISVLVVAARYSVLSPAVRHFIEAKADGLKVSRFGRLKIEGLEGDLWRDFSVRRLTVSDDKGVWLEAHRIGVVWRAGELLQRRFHANSISAGDIRVLRRPILGPAGPPGPSPLSLVIDRMAFQLETLPKFSVRHGLFDVDGDLDVERKGGLEGQIAARSLLHAGDGLSTRFSLGRSRQIALFADASEGKGGALAGALGLPADQAFSLAARVTGATSDGRLSLRATSGDKVPVEAAGSWTPAGGSASGRLSLAASSLTAAYQRMVGSEVRFTVSGAKAPGDMFDLALQANADNLTLQAKGRGDIGKRAAPDGVAVTLKVADLSRILAAPKMGAGLFDGRLAGRDADWKLAGTLTVDRIAAGDYSLARASGPLTLTLAKNEIGLDARIAGAGGRGQGVLGALLGERPQVSATAARLADGRLLIKALQARGAGLKVDASGGRGLLGGLNFKGVAEVSNLAVAHKGAKGALRTDWSAAQSGANKPWTFTLDGRGVSFASGLGEADRLLGAAPRLKAAASYADGAVTVTKASLDGAAASASTSGVLAKDGALRFALDWQAQGPFAAGPIEISGKVKGGGSIGGTVSAPRADLKADIDAIDFPELAIKPAHLDLTFAKLAGGAFDGQFGLTGSSAYGPARAKTAFRFQEDGLDLSDVDADAGGVKASGAISLRGSSPSTADLVLTAGPGAFVTRGKADAAVKIVDAAGGPRGTIRLNADGLALRNSTFFFKTIRLNADGPLAHMPYTVAAEFRENQTPFKLAGSGVADQTGQGANQSWGVSFAGGGRVLRADFKTLEPLHVTFGGGGLSARASLSVAGGKADLDARQTGEAVTVKGTVDGVDLGAFAEDYAGKISGVLAANGKGSRLDGALDARLTGARSLDAAADLALDGRVHAVLADTRLTIEAATSNSKGLKSTASVVLPTEASAAPFRLAIDKTKPISGRFDADGELKPIWDLVYGGEQSLAGRIVAQGTVAGTLNQPKVVGHAALTSGKFEDAGTGLRLQDVTLDADLSQNRVAFRQFSAADGHGGTLSGQGQVSLDAKEASTLTLAAKAFRVIDNDMAQASATGSVTVVRGGDGKAKLTGALTIDRADIAARTRTPNGVVRMDVVERNKPGDEAAGDVKPAAKGPAVALDVALRAPRRIFINGMGLNAELSVDAHVSGTTAAPALTGVARIVRGDYDFGGKRFAFDDQGTIRLATSPDNIKLDLSATRDDPSLTAVIKITGTAAKPVIALTSTPTLPSDEILSQVLFGRSASQLSPVEAAQLAAALASLATGGGFDIIGGLRGLAGLDRLALGGDQASGVTVAGGKYLTDNVYLELAGGGRDGPSAQVEWRLKRSLAIVSKVTSLGDTRLSVRWRKDLGRKDRAPAAQAAP
ncbi:MAG: translocation/assembly module TamB domain-containing protein [Caulobacteraceae bacterium]|nr:translocation/assembly module TamB domain-containing protein [Caulobacteraceae bacterium]